MFSSKGQAFDVFKLLIAAVIAIAILTILLPIINQVINIGQLVPNEEAAKLLKNVGIAEDRTTSDVTFSSQNPTLNATTIAQQTGKYTGDQICVSKGDFENSPDFEGPTATGVIRYVGTSPLSAKLTVMCDRANRLEDSLSSINVAGGDASEWVQQCHQSWQDSCSSDSTRTCCVVAIRNA